MKHLQEICKVGLCNHEREILLMVGSKVKVRKKVKVFVGKFGWVKFLWEKKVIEKASFDRKKKSSK